MFGRVDLKGRSQPDYASYAQWYCEQVARGEIIACEWERLACRRYLFMLQEARKPRSPYYFSADHAIDPCAFIETLPHSKGFEGNIVLEPVQCWWICAIFGFRERGTHRRWVREASLWIPRKNTKTETAKGIVIYCTNFENEPGAECVITAGSEQQAAIPFKAIRHAVTENAMLKEHLLPRDTLEFIKFARTGSEILVKAGRAPNLDGLNPHVALAEELHAQSQEVVGVIKSAQGARLQPLWLSISTAGRTADGPAWESWLSDQQVLRGEMKADRVFIAMYAPDELEQDRRFDPIVVEKVNPLYGVALQEASIESEQREARRSEQKLQEYLRTRLNIWSRAAGNLFSTTKWNLCTDPRLTLSAFKGFPIFVGVDLASHSDLNAACFLVEVGGVLYGIWLYWLPQRSSRFEDDRYADQFTAWAKEGHIRLTPGTHVHHPTILKDVLGMLEGHTVAGFAFDNWQADYLMGAVEEEGHLVYRVTKSAKDLSRATDDLVTRHADPTRMQHDGNPVTTWCFGNVVGRRDVNDNVLPKKVQPNSRQSIDGADAAVLANAARLVNEAGIAERGMKKVVPDPYLTRGLMGETDHA